MFSLTWRESSREKFSTPEAKFQCWWRHSPEEIKSQTSLISNPYLLNIQKAISSTDDKILTHHGSSKLSPGGGELGKVGGEQPTWPPGVDGANSRVEQTVHLTPQQQHNLWD